MIFLNVWEPCVEVSQGSWSFCIKKCCCELVSNYLGIAAFQSTGFCLC